MNILFTIDGKEIEGYEGQSVLQTALKAGIYIPHLCFHPDLPSFKESWPDEVCYQGENEFRSDSRTEGYEGCGLCLVEMEGSEGPVLSCVTAVEEGMTVITSSPRLKARRQENLAKIFELHPHACLTCAQREGCSLTRCSTNVPEDERCCPQFDVCELRRVAEYIGLREDLGRYVSQGLYSEKDKPLFIRDYNLCIGCLRCVRVCSEVVGAKALGYVEEKERIVVGTEKSSIDESGCVYCGACVEVCPTGAIRDKNLKSGERKEALIPCRTACPLGMDVPLYVYYLSQSSAVEAAQLIRDRTPLALSLGYICHRPCEANCRRGELNLPIAICDLKRLALEAKDSREFKNPERCPETGKKVAVVGAGPAGLVSAYYLSFLGHSVTVFESQPEAGGMLRWAIPEYRLPRQVIHQDVKNIESMGVNILTDTPVEAGFFREKKSRDKWDAILLATGLQDSKRIDLEGIDLEGVYWGLDFLREAKEGADFSLGENVVIIGDDNVALDAAMTALRYGPSKVTLVSLESREEMPAFDWEILEAESESVSILNGWGPKKIVGDGSQVEGIELVGCDSVFDEKGCFCPVFEESRSKHLAAQSVILAVGQDADTDYIPEEMDLGSASGNLIQVDKKACKTSIPGVFAGGEAVTGPASAVEAMAMGRRAASAIDRFLGGKGLEEREQEEASFQKGVLWRGQEENFFSRARVDMAGLPPEERIHSFALIQIGYTEEEGQMEAERCLRCHLRFLLSLAILPPEK